MIDDVYAIFEDKITVELMLEHVLGYSPVTVSDLRLDKYRNMTGTEVKKLILSSKSVTSEQIQGLLEKPIVKKVEQSYKDHFNAKKRRSLFGRSMMQAWGDRFKTGSDKVEYVEKNERINRALKIESYVF